LAAILILREAANILGVRLRGLGSFLPGGLGIFSPSFTVETLLYGTVLP
jgi:hypothetical protein